MDRSELPSPSRLFTPALLHPFIPSIFLAFRLVYIPVSVFVHSGHGLPWLNAAAGLIATFGMEALARRGNGAGQPATERKLVALVLVLALIGFFPEEGPVGVILWAAGGALWGWLTAREMTPGRLWWPGLLLGGLLGLGGWFGPASWLMAGLLMTRWGLKYA